MPDMKTYFLKLANREVGPYSEEDVSQLFADGQANRDTLCRPAGGGDWKTIDDYLPMLKYGTQLPNPTSPVVRSKEPPAYGYGSTPPRLPQERSQADMRVSVVDFDLPFGSILKLMFKWMAAGFLVFCCFIPAIIALLFITLAIFGSLLNGVFGGLHHP